MEEQTKMEKNNATKYIPTQKKNEFQPPMAERVVFGFMDITLVFSRVLFGVVSYAGNYTNRGLIEIKIGYIINPCKRKTTLSKPGRKMTGRAKNYLVKAPIA
jgi:hypothetical protein